MAGSLIGNLAILLSMDTAAFEKGTSHASKLLAKTQREFEKVGKQMQRIGRDLSTRVTLPILGLGAASIKMAGDFETSMNNVGISTQATANEMKQMRDLALELGKSTVFGASEAADAMDDLAKTGLDTKTIINGAAKATADLAAAAGTKMAPAAIAIADSMKQFHLQTDDLPKVVNQITGAVNQSKLGFEDYQLAIAQAGGVAGGLGVSFTDFNAALAGTSALFASGSDAGTSFKTFLTFLVPKSNAAAAVMEKYGLAFFKASGEMKSMGEIAEMLRVKLSGLSDEAKNEVLKEIFGTDAMRTAIGLMDLGAKGLDNIAGKIAATDAAAQSAERMKGFNAQLEQLKGAAETLAITLGDAGLLSAMTGLIKGLTDFISKMSEASPATLRWGLAIAAVAAAIGPLVTIFGGAFRVIGFLLPLIVKLGPAFKALAGAITLARVAGLALLPALTPILIPLGLITAAVTAGYLAWRNWDKISPIVGRMVGAVKGHLATLGNVLKAVLTPIESVRRGFFNLWDKVVGRSYIPDMVDGIAEQMARLDAVMVAPVTAATSKAAEAFRQLQTEVRGLLDRLFPEAAALNTFKSEVALLEQAMKKGILTAEQYAEALGRLQTEGLTDVPILEEPQGSLVPANDDVMGNIERGVDGVLGKVDQVSQSTQEWQNILSNVAIDLARMGGDILSGLLDKSLSLKDAWRGILSYAIQFLTSSQGMNLLAGAFGGKREMGGPVVRGKTYLVGENGPELFSPGTSGQVISNDNLRGAVAGAGARGDIHFHGIRDYDGFNRNKTQIRRETRRAIGV